MKKIIPLLIIITFLAYFTPTLSADSLLKVVTTLPTYGEVVKEIGGDRVTVKILLSPGADFHNLVVRPGHIADLARADLFVHSGLDSEPWKGALIESAANLKIFPGNPGDFPCSKDILLLEIPQSLSREGGDVHAGGNPHFWMDPINLIIIGRNLKSKLIELDPTGKEGFEERFKNFATLWSEKLKGWISGLKGKQISFIDYHNSWPYLANRFSFKIVDHIEPKPGIKPSGTHLRNLLKKGAIEKVDFVLGEPHQNPRDLGMISENLKIPLLILNQSPSLETGLIAELDHFFQKVGQIP